MYPEPPTIEAEVEFVVEGAGKSCKTVRSYFNALNLFSGIALRLYKLRNFSIQTLLVHELYETTVLIQEVALLHFLGATGTHFTSLEILTSSKT
jgi:uncharacterized protein (UPF0179 family)